MDKTTISLPKLKIKTAREGNFSKSFYQALLVSLKISFREKKLAIYHSSGPGSEPSKLQTRCLRKQA